MAFRINECWQVGDPCRHQESIPHPSVDDPSGWTDSRSLTQVVRGAMPKRRKPTSLKGQCERMEACAGP